MTTGRPALLMLTVLGLDGVVSAVMGALFLGLYAGPVPVPLSALLSGLLNAALVWAASFWTDSRRLAAIPLFTWLATVAVFALGGPGSDVVLGGAGAMAAAPLILLLLGAVPPVLVLRRLA